MKKRGIIIVLTISFFLSAYGQNVEPAKSPNTRVQQSDTLTHPKVGGKVRMLHKPVRESNSPSNNPVPPSKKQEVSEQMRDTLATKPDTLSSSLEIPVSMQDTIAVSNLVLPQGAKDTTTLSFRDTDLRDIFRALATKHSLNLFIDNTINKHSTISLSNVQVYDAINFICQQNNLRLSLDGGIFKILQQPPSPKAEPLPAKVPWIY